MFFMKQQTLVNQRALTYKNQIATLVSFNHGRGRAILDDKTSWRILCDFDCEINSNVIVIGVVDKMTLKVIPCN